MTELEALQIAHDKLVEENAKLLSTIEEMGDKLHEAESSARDIRDKLDSLISDAGGIRGAAEDLYLSI